VLIADRFSGFVSTGYNRPYDLSRPDAWCTVLSYFIQLYFDFSSYSEMAIGLARMFNVTFPANFDSPYKAPNVIEFWQRWHMSLTRYVNLYVYNPIALAITRRRYAKSKPANAAALRTPDGFAQIVALPTVITMILIGVWHGSGLQFLVFGVLHGVYLCIAHAWRLINSKKKKSTKSALVAYASEFPSILLTCAAVMVGQVFFRAQSVPDALAMLGNMTLWPTAHGASSGDTRTLLMIACALAWVWTMPNTLQLFAAQNPALAKSRAQKPLIDIMWRPTPAFGTALGILFLYSFLCVTGTTEFLYFRF
jgi:D-alanyl-lipoteichoic acid acyltransferase DltB (MBOAT superfamily)